MKRPLSMRSLFFSKKMKKLLDKKTGVRDTILKRKEILKTPEKLRSRERANEEGR